MPRITIENKIDKGNGIKKILPEIYELDERIFYKGQLYVFDKGHQAYFSLSNGEYLCSAKEYLQMMLNTNQNEDDNQKKV